MTLNLKREEPLLLSLCIRHVDVHLNDLLWALVLDEQRLFVPEHQRGRGPMEWTAACTRSWSVVRFFFLSLQTLIILLTPKKCNPSGIKGGTLKKYSTSNQAPTICILAV